MAFTDNHRYPSGIDQTFPVLVTCADHGLTEGQFIRATNFFRYPEAKATGMYQLNNKLFQVANPTTDTFELYNEAGLPIDGTNYSMFTNNGLPQFTLTGPALFTENMGGEE